MKEKIATYVVLIGLIVLSFFYFNEANNYPEASKIAHDAGYFPRILAILLIVLCVISLVQTKLENSEEKIVIPNFKIVLATVLITALYIASWNLLGYFYIQTFLFLTILNSVFRIPSKGFNRNNILIILFTSLLITLLIYVIFEVVMPLPVKF